MIFSETLINHGFQVLESYKERNLYYKVFAGYLFNELLPEYASTKKAFFDLLIQKSVTPGEHFGPQKVNEVPSEQIFKELTLQDLHVTFDYHLIQNSKDKNDRGEVSDILIWGQEKYFISIEAKFLTDWSYEKDIIKVQERIIGLQEKFPEKKGIQILLIKEQKWLNANNKTGVPGSNIAKLTNESLKVPLIIITWQELNKCIKNSDVNSYLDRQLARKISDFK